MASICPMSAFTRTGGPPGCPSPTGTDHSPKLPDQFDTNSTRTIHIDVRYIGGLLTQDPRAEWILTEMWGGRKS